MYELKLCRREDGLVYIDVLGWEREKGKQAVQESVLMVGKMFTLTSECKVMFIHGSEIITPSRIG